MAPATKSTRSDAATIRRLWPFDQEAICDHFLRLDPIDRRMRFGGAVDDDFIRRYAASLLSLDALIYGAFPNGELRAVAELRGLLDSWPSMAEAAFSVETDFQGQGLGDALMTRIIASARNRGIHSLYMICLSGNERMQHLASKHHADLAYHPGEVEATLDAPWPSFSSLKEEVAGEFDSFVRAVLYWPPLGQT